MGGGATHNAQIGADYAAYGAWCRSVAGVIRSSPYFDSTKVFVVYIGRNPDHIFSNGLHTNLLGNADRSIDWMALSGYLGGNLNYDPEIPAGESEIDYYKEGIALMGKYLYGLEQNISYFNTLTKGARFKFYFYESNMTTPAYNGRHGQAITMLDYFMSSLKLGSGLPSIFHLTGGQWRITDPSKGYKRLPLFQMAKHINRQAKGNVLRTKVESVEILKNSNNVNLQGVDPVGVQVVHEHGKYKVLYFSRDFETDHQVQLNFEDGIVVGNTAKKYVFTAADYNSLDIYKYRLLFSVYARQPLGHCT